MAQQQSVGAKSMVTTPAPRGRISTCPDTEHSSIPWSIV
jgi:hypothetical protein